MIDYKLPITCGRAAQVKLQNASIIVVGAGGLGCPALQYLCAAGVGRIGIVDPDVVELSNLQRQILHSEATLGMPKVESAAQALKRLNSRTVINTYNVVLDVSNAECLLKRYDVALDCSDNAPTRYLLSDTAARLALPLVSGAAQRLDGQLCTYNLPLPPHPYSPSTSHDAADKAQGNKVEHGPCYRCLFPRPPAPEMAASCAETGILGAVTGVIGTLQALEAIKLITDLNNRKPTLLIYSALGVPPFRSITLRARRKTCPACGDGDASGERIALESDYVAFCGGPRPDWVQKGLEIDNSRKRRRISAKELDEKLATDKYSVRILDVRSPVEFSICHLPGSYNVPLTELVACPSLHRFGTYLTHHSSVRDAPVLTVLVCRLGNDSQIAADALRECEASNENNEAISSIRDSESILQDEIMDLIGGLRSWAADVDPRFPVY
ncbi:hypothetical protein EW145_g5676 [Phellinidium pouzarii]|uniref:Rhodanese domain-containing protein n=1 Tax=Phellinidium pouzarii TaxID=167371 RepID=A0A4S4KZS2_9AGAM|nr:hypothetical protein EW145_g5676 [Phellinidium pouzarii]